MVIDASACVDLVLETPRAPRLEELLDGRRLRAPDLLDLEVTSALARLGRSGGVGPGHIELALGDFLSLPVRRRSSHALAREAWSLRSSLRISDAYYVAAARSLGAPLLTTDGRLARGAPGDVEILLVE